MPALVWSPIHRALDERASGGDNLFFVIAPYVKVEALRLLFESATPRPGLKLVARWLPGDLLVGVSDLEVFGYLSERGAQLYINPRVHLKVYAFESNYAISTSGNLTLAGLGYADATKANIEVGTAVDLGAADWVNLYKVVNGSRLMTPELFARFREYVQNAPPVPLAPPGPDLLGPHKLYTIGSLPAVDSPDELCRFYFDRIPSVGADFRRRAYHDLAMFAVPGGLAQTDFFNVLRDGFLRSPFVVDFIEHLRVQGSLHFGAVNAWIHQKCEDVPLPYRWEIKKNTHAFYNWLAHFLPQVTWDRPNHSQVIYWARS